MPAAGAGFSRLQIDRVLVSPESEFSIPPRPRFGGFFCSEQGLPLAFGTAAPQVLDREIRAPACEVGGSLFRLRGPVGSLEG